MRESGELLPNRSKVLATFALPVSAAPGTATYAAVDPGLVLPAGSYYAVFAPLAGGVGSLLGGAFSPVEYRAGSLTVWLSSGAGPTTQYAAVRILGRPLARPEPTPTEVPAASHGPTALGTLPGAPGPWLHVVAAGETLWDIARAFDLSLDDLLAVNPDVRDPALIHTGDRLTVPHVAPAKSPGEERPLSIVVLATGSHAAEATDINDAGEVVGATAGDDELLHGFLWSGGSTIGLPTIGGNWSAPVAISDAGQIVGYGPVGPGGQGEHRGFLWQEGRVSLIGPSTCGLPADINDLGQVLTRCGATVLWRNAKTELVEFGTGTAEGTNNLGHVVGAHVVLGEPPHAFVWQRGAVADLPSLRSEDAASIAHAINDRGVVVGDGEGPSGWNRTLRWEQGLVQDVWEPAELTVDIGALAINDAGRIAGYVTPNGGAGPNQAVVWDAAGVRTLELLGGTSWATGVNTAGIVTGAAQDASGAWHAVVWLDYASLHTMTEQLVADPAAAGALTKLLDEAALREAGGDSAAEGRLLEGYRQELRAEGGGSLSREAALTLAYLSNGL